MSKQKVNHLGRRFGRLIVIADSKRKGSYWICLCDCGQTREVMTGALTSGNTQGCGCHRGLNHTHGHSITLARQRKASRTYRAWAAMKARCTLPSQISYKNYGGRGIKVCDEWLAFEQFLSDMGECPDGMSIDRIDNDGDYSPSNCRWANLDQQANNRRNNWRIEYAGEVYSLACLARITGVERKTLAYRLSHGWSISKAVSPTK